ncbi:MAG: DUF192 domain-containing protein [Brevinematia bacterium]
MKKSIELIVLLILFTTFSYALTKTTNVKIITSNGTNTFICELATTEEEWEIGLMYRKDLKPNNGMLFIFPFDSYISFWMKNTYIPLAIIFIDSDKNITDVYYPKPLSTNSIIPSKPCRYVLEILSNSGVNINVKKGDKILF